MQHKIQYIVTGRCQSGSSNESITVFYYLEVEGQNIASLREQYRYLVEREAKNILCNEYKKKKNKYHDYISYIKVSW